MKFEEEAWSSEAGKPVGLPGRGSYLEDHKRKNEFQKTEEGKGPPRKTSCPSQGLARVPLLIVYTLHTVKDVPPGFLCTAQCSIDTLKLLC